MNTTHVYFTHHEFPSGKVSELLHRSTDIYSDDGFTMASSIDLVNVAPEVSFQIQNPIPRSNINS